MPAAIFSVEDAKRIAEVVRWYESRPLERRDYRRPRPAVIASSGAPTYVQITDSAAWNTNANRYWYSGYQVEWDSANSQWQQKTDGLVFDKDGEAGPRILNGCEANNPASTSPAVRMGNGVVCGTVDGVVVSLLPLDGDPVVACWPVTDAGQTVAWMCSVPNAVDVICPPP